MSEIQHQNITQQVIAYMIKNIESGNWKLGEKIPSENTLTTELGVSRSSIRQAVSHFAGIGVMVSYHGKGTFLVDNEIDSKSSKNKITAEDCMNVENVLEFRRILESEACYMAVVKGDSDLLKHLKKYLEIMKASKDDIGKFVAADINFHKEICHASGNPLLEKSMGRIFQENKKSQLLTRQTFGYHDGIHYHELIIRAVEEKNPKMAKEYMYQHMQNGIDKIKANREIEFCKENEI